MFRTINPPSVRPPFARYSHAVEVPPGARLLVCSGQLGITVEEHVPADPEEQARLCFSAVRAILAEGGMQLSDIVRLNAYVTDREAMAAYMRVRDSIVGEAPPASTLIMVTGFARPEFRVELEVIAAKVDPR